jgi:hypothetical protein
MRKKVSVMIAMMVTAFSVSAGVIVSDTFTGTDSSSLGSTEIGGLAWNVKFGRFENKDNEARLNSGLPAYAVVSTNVANGVYTLSAVFNGRNAPLSLAFTELSLYFGSGPGTAGQDDGADYVSLAFNYQTGQLRMVNFDDDSGVYYNSAVTAGVLTDFYTNDCVVVFACDTQTGQMSGSISNTVNGEVVSLMHTVNTNLINGLNTFGFGSRGFGTLTSSTGPSVDHFEVTEEVAAVSSGDELVFDSFTRLDGSLGTTEVGDLSWDVKFGRFDVQEAKAVLKNNLPAYAVVTTNVSDGAYYVSAVLNGRGAPLNLEYTELSLYFGSGPGTAGQDDSQDYVSAAFNYQTGKLRFICFDDDTTNSYTSAVTTNALAEFSTNDCMLSFTYNMLSGELTGSVSNMANGGVISLSYSVDPAIFDGLNTFGFGSRGFGTLSVATGPSVDNFFVRSIPLEPRFIYTEPVAGADMRKIVVGINFARDQWVPLGVNDLVNGAWTHVAHSDDALNPFLVTNMLYSSSEDGNRVFYIQMNDFAKFISIVKE